MRHRAARHLVPQLLDHTLPGPLELLVREHAERCRRCGRRLAEFELCSRLVAQLPLGLMPFATSASGEERLAGLARWDFQRRSRLREPLEGLAVVAAAAALAGVVALAGTVQWIPSAAKTESGVIQVAYVIPGPARAR